MIKCTGAHCPIQYDPEKPFNPMECQAADTCPNATPINDNSLWIALIVAYAYLKGLSTDALTSEILKCKNKEIEDLNKRKELLSKDRPPIRPYTMLEFSQCNCYSDICESGTSFEQSCYFYHEEQDMGAHIPCCNKTGKMDPNGCNKECKYYISKETAFRIISDYQSHEDEE